MRAGWIRPSFINISRAIRATCRRIGSKLERIIMPGVSSTMISTPVARCKAWIFRPSLPMIRPFISSSSSFTAVTVRSAVTSPLIRSIAVRRIICARSSASSAASCCNFDTKPTRSFLISRSVICMSFSAASFFLSPAIFSSFSCCLVRISRISDFSPSTSSSCARSFSARLSSSSSLWSSDFSRSANRFSVFCISLRRSFSIRKASSFAFRTISLAFVLAFAISCSILFLPRVCLVRWYPTKPPAPAPIPTRAAIIISIMLFLSFGRTET